MPNQPAAGLATIYLRLPQEIKDAIQVEVDRLNADNPGASYSMSSWIRAAIDAKLKPAKKNK